MVLLPTAGAYRHSGARSRTAGRIDSDNTDAASGHVAGTCLVGINRARSTDSERFGARDRHGPGWLRNARLRSFNRRGAFTVFDLFNRVRGTLLDDDFLINLGRNMEPA